MQNPQKLKLDYKFATALPTFTSKFLSKVNHFRKAKGESIARDMWFEYTNHHKHHVYAIYLLVFCVIDFIQSNDNDIDDEMSRYVCGSSKIENSDNFIPNKVIIFRSSKIEL